MTDESRDEQGKNVMPPFMGDRTALRDKFHIIPEETPPAQPPYGNS